MVLLCDYQTATEEEGATGILRAGAQRDPSTNNRSYQCSWLTVHLRLGCLYASFFAALQPTSSWPRCEYFRLESRVD